MIVPYLIKKLMILLVGFLMNKQLTAEDILNWEDWNTFEKRGLKKQINQIQSILDEFLEIVIKEDITIKQAKNIDHFLGIIPTCMGVIFMSTIAGMPFKVGGKEYGWSTKYHSFYKKIFIARGCTKKEAKVLVNKCRKDLYD